MILKELISCLKNPKSCTIFSKIGEVLAVKNENKYLYSYTKTPIDFYLKCDVKEFSMNNETNNLDITIDYNNYVTLGQVLSILSKEQKIVVIDFYNKIVYSELQPNYVNISTYMDDIVMNIEFKSNDDGFLYVVIFLDNPEKDKRRIINDDNE